MLSRFKIFFTIVSCILPFLLLFWYVPNFVADFELRLAPYRGDMYAVHLDSGEVYYGSILGFARGFIKLRNVHYFETITIVETTTNNFVSHSENGFTRPKSLIIERSKILFLERVGKDAKIMELFSDV